MFYLQHPRRNLASTLAAAVHLRHRWQHAGRMQRSEGFVLHLLPPALAFLSQKLLILPFPYLLVPPQTRGPVIVPAQFAQLPE